MVEVGGYNRQDPTAGQSGKSWCQLSFAWSDVSEEMGENRKRLLSPRSLILWSLRRNYVTTEQTDLHSLCSSFVPKGGAGSRQTGFCCRSLLFWLHMVFSKQELICQPCLYLHKYHWYFTLRVLTCEPSLLGLYAILDLVIPSFCPAEIYPPSLSNLSWCL